MRLRPRFTIRTLAIFVTLVCAYFGAWEATKRYAVLPPEDRCIFTLRGEQVTMPLEQQDDFLLNELDRGNGFFVLLEIQPVAPLVVVQDEQVFKKTGPDGDGGERLTYYLWLLGPKIRLWETSPM
jgi:hypothetical protein